MTRMSTIPIRSQLSVQAAFGKTLDHDVVFLCGDFNTRCMKPNEDAFKALLTVDSCLLIIELLLFAATTSLTFILSNSHLIYTGGYEPAFKSIWHALSVYP